MKSLLCVVLIAFVVQVSAQNRPDLSCYECHDCTSVETDTPRRSCYAPAQAPQIPTVPPPVVLTPPPAPGAAVISEELNPMNSNARQGQLFTCYTIRREVGDRQITTRGCALVHQNEEKTCAYQNQGEVPHTCWLCAEDDCNEQVAGVSKTFASISLLFTLLLVTLRFI